MELTRPFVFKHLSNPNCPTCKAGVKSCSIDGEHCNGQQFETVVYNCGCTIKHVPNFSRSETTKLCPKSLKMKKQTLVTELLVKQISRLVDSQKHLSDKSKARLKESMLDHSVLWNVDCK